MEKMNVEPIQMVRPCIDYASSKSGAFKAHWDRKGQFFFIKKTIPKLLKSISFNFELRISVPQKSAMSLSP